MKTENMWATALIGVTILWGWSFVAIHETLSTLSATAFNAFRFLIGGIVMLIFLARKPRRIGFDELKDGAVAGLALFVAFTFQTTGIAYTTASNASFITGLAVVFTPLFALVLLKVQPNKQQAFGAVMAAVGLALLTISNLSVYVGDVLVLGCAVFTALHIVILSKVSKNHDAEVLAFIQVMVVGVLSLVWSIATGAFEIQRFRDRCAFPNQLSLRLHPFVKCVAHRLSPALSEPAALFSFHCFRIALDLVKRSEEGKHESSNLTAVIDIKVEECSPCVCCTSDTL